MGQVQVSDPGGASRWTQGSSGRAPIRHCVESSIQTWQGHAAKRLRAEYQLACLQAKPLHYKPAYTTFSSAFIPKALMARHNPGTRTSWCPTPWRSAAGGTWCTSRTTRRSSGPSSEGDVSTILCGGGREAPTAAWWKPRFVLRAMVEGAVGESYALRHGQTP